METHKLHRGRLIDHIQIVTQDLGRMRRFYQAVLEVLGISIGGEGPDFFWADELFISSQESIASQRKLTGRMHFAFQAKDRRRSIAFTRSGSKRAAATTVSPVRARTIPGTTRPS